MLSYHYHVLLSYEYNYINIHQFPLVMSQVMCKRVLMSEEMKTEILPALQRATDMQVQRNGWSK